MSLKLTQSQKIFVKNLVNMSELFLQMIITPFKFVRIAKVRTVLKRAGAELSKTYHIFSNTPLGAEIFEFKVDPAPKTKIILH